MSFMNIETGEVADAFFNVDIRAQRGLKKYYRIGNTGQFFPKPHSKFRKFWMAAVGSPPRSWSRAHLEMRPRMKGLIFTGDVTPSRMSNGKNYMMIKNLQLWEQDN